jgi:micrococcal nuclease
MRGPLAVSIWSVLVLTFVGGAAIALEEAASPARHVVLLDEVREPQERRQPEIAIRTSSGNGAREVRLAGHDMKIPPTLELLCPGRRIALTLSRSGMVDSRAVALYEASAVVVTTALRSSSCELWVVGSAIPIPRDAFERAWGGEPFAASAPELVAGRVLQVTGIDTIRVAVDGRTEDVRYRGIEARPTNVLTTGASGGARTAIALARRLVDGKMVRLEVDGDERDGEGRLLAWVWTGDVLVNAEIVRHGHARVRTPAGRHEDLLLAAQREAQRGYRGIWVGHATKPPRPPAAVSPPKPGVEPEPTGACPVQQPIKASVDSEKQCTFHVPGGFLYTRTRPHRCYSTQDEATRDGCKGSRL